MRTFEVVDGAPGIEGALQVGQVAEAPHREQLGLQGAMEAFVLAAALRMIGSGIDDIDAEPQQPDTQTGPRRSPEPSRGEPLSTKNASGMP
jgi:hypothetical protein